MRFTLLALLTGFAAQLLWADPTNPVVAVDGVLYSNVTFDAVTPATVTLRHSTGVATVLLDQLSPDLQQKFGYDPERARTYLETVQKAELARWQAWQKRQADLKAQQAKEQAEQLVLAQQAAAAKPPPIPVSQLSFVSVANVTPLGPEIYRAVLIGPDGGSATVRFDESGRQFLLAAMAEQDQIQAGNEQRRAQAEAARGFNYSSAIVLTPYSSGVKESPPLKYTIVPPKVFTVYAVRMSEGPYRLVGSHKDPRQEGAAGVSW